jgi:glycosyltransferase involved in cell wall biosynthesis
MKLSVEISSLNEGANTSALLERLLNTPGVTDVVVADGSSTDATTDFVRPPVRLVRSGAGRGI